MPLHGELSIGFLQIIIGGGLRNLENTIVINTHKEDGKAGHGRRMEDYGSKKERKKERKKGGRKEGRKEEDEDEQMCPVSVSVSVCVSEL